MVGQLSTSIIRVVQLLTAARAVGIAPEELCNQAGIDLELLHSVGNRVPLSAIYTILDQVAKQSGDDYFWLRAVRPELFPPENVYFYTLFQARTLREGLIRAQRLYTVITDDFRLSHHINGDELSIRLSFNLPDRCVNPHLLDWFVSSYFCLPQMFCGKDIFFHELRLRAPFSCRAGVYQEYFSFPVKSDQEFTEWALPCAILDLPNIAIPYNPCLDQILKQNEKFTAQPDNESDEFRRLLHSTLEKHMPSGDQSLEEISNRLSISARSLQRRLTDLGTSFTEELHKVRSKKAIDLLKKPKISISEIAYLLGFKSNRSLSIAFRKWYGITPTEYRQKFINKQ